jgi:hypothetical protein
LSRNAFSHKGKSGKKSKKESEFLYREIKAVNEYLNDIPLELFGEQRTFGLTFHFITFSCCCFHIISVIEKRIDKSS